MRSRYLNAPPTALAPRDCVEANGKGTASAGPRTWTIIEAMFFQAYERATAFVVVTDAVDAPGREIRDRPIRSHVVRKLRS
jgi:hypothetical protein